MTDNEIIKALECCQQTRCMECPLWKKRHNCMNKLYEYALDLINRKNSQLLKEQNKNSKLRNERNRLKAEVEEKTKKLQEILPIVAELKTEAVKEFAEIIVSDYPEMEYYLDELRKDSLGGNE